VCGRCGADKAAFDFVCGACGHRPEGDGLLTAWLLSDAHLSPDQLERAATRLRRGESIRPSDAMLATARRALGRDGAADTGLRVSQRAGLFALALALTPLPGLTLWWWWRRDRPRSAAQALAMSVPPALVWVVAVLSHLAASLGRGAG
jgi:hypothetical protein